LLDINTISFSIRNQYCKPTRCGIRQRGSNSAKLTSGLNLRVHQNGGRRESAVHTKEREPELGCSRSFTAYFETVTSGNCGWLSLPRQCDRPKIYLTVSFACIRRRLQPNYYMDCQQVSRPLFLVCSQRRLRNVENHCFPKPAACWHKQRTIFEKASWKTSAAAL
jgi:hypothetical protein